MTAQLQKWQRPDEMRSLLEQLRERHGFYCVAHGSMKPWREAFCAAAFANVTSATAVKLGEDRSGDDFCLRIKEKKIAFQLVETYKPGRRRSSEFNEFAQLYYRGKKTPPFEHYDPTEEASSLPKLIADAVRKKAAKRYPPTTMLAVYAEVQMFTALETVVEAGIRDAVAPYTPSFRAIWVLIPGWTLLKFPHAVRRTQKSAP